MGKALSILQRKINRFNVENRAHKIISQDKPTPAPKHPSTIQHLASIAKDYPEIMEWKEKDAHLQDRLKQVYVVSHDPEVEKSSKQIRADDDDLAGSRALPVDRKTVADFEFGFMEPTRIPHGRCTLREALKFIGDHQADPKTWTAQAIAAQYNMETELLEKVLHYYRTFEVYIPEHRDKTHQLYAEPSKVKEEQLEPGKSSAEK